MPVAFQSGRAPAQDVRAGGLTRDGCCCVGDFEEYGEVSERSKEHDWKSCIRPKRIAGSNPALSARFGRHDLIYALARGTSLSGSQLGSTALRALRGFFEILPLRILTRIQ